jgi:hypothetical protein
MLFSPGKGSAYISFLHNLIMASKDFVHMCYVAKQNTDDVFDLFKRLMYARDSVNFHYPEEIECKVDIPDSIGRICVSIKENQEGKLTEAVKEYLSIVNSHPYRNELECVLPCSNFDALEAALPPGKKLKRKLKQLFMGKYVVDAK